MSFTELKPCLLFEKEGKRNKMGGFSVWFDTEGSNYIGVYVVGSSHGPLPNLCLSTLGMWRILDIVKGVKKQLH